MKVLLIGSGGREHALAWKIRRDVPAAEIVCAPGNPGIATLGRCVPVKATDVDALVALAEAERPDFTMVGPEAPLALGLVDRFRARGLAVFGPTQAAAQLETSKAFTKQLMLEAGVPTARATRHTDVDDAKRAARALGAPVVVKASGLAAGKGVIIAESIAEADRAIDFMLRDEGFGEAGAEILVEEYMEGEELSVFYVTDGTRAIPLPAAQDHKRLLAGDAGPNTGGMGAYAPVSLQDYVASGFEGESHEQEADASIGALVASGFVAGVALGTVVEPTLAAMRARGIPFTGLLYAGLMLTRQGPKVVEFNCRFGDPETQAVLPLLDRAGVPLVDLFATVARGGRLPSEWGISSATWGAAVTTVLAGAGYPDAPRTGDAIALPATLPDGAHIFHAGTALDRDGRLVTAGGRVLAVTAVAATFEDAQRTSRHIAEQVQFDGKQFRPDIGWREVARRARASRD